MLQGENKNVSDKGKGKAKVIEETDSDSEDSPSPFYDSTSDNDLYRAIQESKQQARENKKGESSQKKQI